MGCSISVEQVVAFAYIIHVKQPTFFADRLMPPMRMVAATFASSRWI